MMLTVCLQAHVFYLMVEARDVVLHSVNNRVYEKMLQRRQQKCFVTIGFIIYRVNDILNTILIHYVIACTFTLLRGCEHLERKEKNMQSSF